MKRVVKLAMIAAFVGMFSFNSYSQDDPFDLYEKTIQAVQMSNFDNAIGFANKAYKTAKAEAEPTPELSEVIKNLENTIPQLYLSKAKKSFADSQYADAISQFSETAEIAKKFNDEAVQKEAEESIAKVYLKEGNDLYNADSFDGAIASFDKALALDSTNSQVYLLRAVSYLKKGDNTNALTAMEKTIESAKATGNSSVESQATTQLATIYLKEANAAQKVKKWADVIKNAEKSLSYNDSNATAKKLLDLGNYQSGAALKDNKAKACQFFKKVQHDDQLKAAAAQMMKALGCS